MLRLDSKDVPQESSISPGRDLLSTRLITITSVVGLFVVALVMRLYLLGVPSDRDYDEGVYWQSLRSLAHGHPLYSQTFYSQPPGFLLSIYPFFVALGSSLWSARFGIACISLLGLFGIWLLGRALFGNPGGIAALLLLLLEPLYLAQSQVIQAEIPSIAFSTLAVGLAFLWWEAPEGRKGNWLAALAGFSLIAGILSKLLVLATIIPIGLLFMARLVMSYRQRANDPLQVRRGLYPLLWGVSGALLAALLLILPFMGASHNFVDQVISFHIVASKVGVVATGENLDRLIEELKPMPLTWLALYGTGVALWCRDWRVLPLLTWFLATFVLLARQEPLFSHHFVAMIPPLVGLSILGLSPLTGGLKGLSGRKFQMVGLGVVIGGLLIVCLLNIFEIQEYYREMYQISPNVYADPAQEMGRDIQRLVPSGKMVITDSQFTAGLADRDTPPNLVDTSNVRLSSGYLTMQELEVEGARPDVRAVAFVTGRLYTDHRVEFYQWVHQHYRLVKRYPNYDNAELWVKP